MEAPERGLKTIDVDDVADVAVVDLLVVVILDLHDLVAGRKRLVVLVGQKKAIAIAVRNVSGRRRWSKLDEWLRVGALSRSSNSSKAD